MDFPTLFEKLVPRWGALGPETDTVYFPRFVDALTNDIAILALRPILADGFEIFRIKQRVKVSWIIANHVNLGVKVKSCLVSTSVLRIGESLRGLAGNTLSRLPKANPGVSYRNAC